MTSPNEAANYPQIQRIGDRECNKDKGPMPRLKTPLIEANREVRGFDEQSNLHRSQRRGDTTTPPRNRRQGNDLRATMASEPEEEPQRHRAENDREHELAEKSDHGGARSRQRNASDIGRNQETFRNTALECQ